MSVQIDDQIHSEFRKHSNNIHSSVFRILSRGDIRYQQFNFPKGGEG